MSSVFLIKALFIVGGLVLCGLLYVAMNNDTERFESAQKLRQRIKAQAARFIPKNKT